MIIDAHQHFWDPGRHYYPWLCDEPPIPFRYGDYGAICRRYPVREVVGHEHVAPARKHDPGPGFDWQRLAPLRNPRLPGNLVRSKKSATVFGTLSPVSLLLS